MRCIERFEMRCIERVKMKIFFCDPYEKKTNYRQMKKLIFLLATLGLVVSCTSYSDREYGPVSFQAAFEDGDEWLFEGSNIEAVATIKFNPEEYGFSKESVGGMRLDRINIKTENEELSLSLLENIQVEVSSNETEMLTIGVLNSVPDALEVSFEGREDAKIKNFNKVDEFYLHISGNLREEVNQPFEISGEFTLKVESSQE